MGIQILQIIMSHVTDDGNVNARFNADYKNRFGSRFAELNAELTTKRTKHKEAVEEIEANYRKAAKKIVNEKICGINDKIKTTISWVTTVKVKFEEKYPAGNLFRELTAYLTN